MSLDISSQFLLLSLRMILWFIVARFHPCAMVPGTIKSKSFRSELANESKNVLLQMLLSAYGFIR